MGLDDGLGKELSGQEMIEQLTLEGYHVTRTFSPELAQKEMRVEGYIEELKQQGKTPGVDFKFFVMDGEAVVMEK